MKVTTPFISAGCNRHPSAASWQPSSSTCNSGILAYAAGKVVALWDPQNPQHRGVRRTLKGHKETINAVQWVSIPIYLEVAADEAAPAQAPVVEKAVLISGSGGAQAEVAVWAHQGRGEDRDEAEVDFVLEKIEKVGGSVNDIASTTDREFCGRTGRVVAIACADGSIIIWEIWGIRTTETQSRVSIHIKQIQTLTTKPRFLPLALSLSTLPGTNSEGLILAVAGSTAAVQAYVSSGVSESFLLRATLVGHENWVRSLEFTYENPADPEGSDLLLASASQDKYIRLWRVHQGEGVSTHGGKSNIGAGFGIALGKKSGLSNKAHRFRTTGANAEREYSITFEALLMGHEDWIYTIAWRPVVSGGLQLLSTSADNSISLWNPDPDSGIWLSTVRLGEISEQKGSSSTTGTVGGLWIGLWSPKGNQVAALGGTGGWRLWEYSNETDRWAQKVAVGGHVRGVTGVSWGGPGKAWLISTGLDQTTRLWAKWSKVKGGGDGWHEFSRPQVHGYDINCVTWLPKLEGWRGGYQFVSGADEKLLRVFEEPKGVAALLQRLADCGGDTTTNSNDIENLPEGAEQPVLGLSNKLLTTSTISDPPGPTAEEPVPSGMPQSTILFDLPHPPLEDHLSRHTLWPETEKLYGHGLELSSVTCAHTIPLIATSCRASSVEHAAIRLFDTKQGRQVKPKLRGGHSLSVLRMEFSPDDEWLLSVGRDRIWVVYKRNKTLNGTTGVGGSAEVSSVYEAVSRQPAKGGHSRVIWDGKWAPLVYLTSLSSTSTPGSTTTTSATPNTLPRLFATASRDKSAKIWLLNEEGDPSAAKNSVTTAPTISLHNTTTLKFPAPVTALAFLPEVVNIEGDSILTAPTTTIPNEILAQWQYILAIALETGDILIYHASVEKPGEWALCSELESHTTPEGAVLDMNWRPLLTSGSGTPASARSSVARELAVAGEDGSVRIFEVMF